MRLKITQTGICPIIKYGCIVLVILKFVFVRINSRPALQANTTQNNKVETLPPNEVVRLKTVRTSRSFDMDEEYQKFETTPDRPFPAPINISLAEINLFHNFHQKREYPITRVGG